MKTLLLAAALALGSSAASAAVQVLGDGIGRDCFVFARDGVSHARAIETCDAAVADRDLSRRDRAASHVNRGVIRLRRTEHADALADFDAAVGLMPALAEAHIDRGAALVMLNRHQEALASLDRGLELGPGKPQNGHFIRGVAREGAGDVKGAYEDFRKAAELDPEWGRPKRELRRFSVRRGG